MTDRDGRWRDLLRQARRGDGAAYAAFLTDITPVLRRIAAARSRGRPEDVEDIVQEVLLAVHLKRHTWAEDRAVAPWLYAIARYKAADAARRRGMPVVDIDDLSEVLADERADDPVAARDLGRLMDGIDARSAAIVRSVGLDGDSAAEVGARMGMTDGAVRVAYHRALARLKRIAGGGA